MLLYSPHFLLLAEIYCRKHDLVTHQTNSREMQRCHRNALVGWLCYVFDVNHIYSIGQEFMFGCCLQPAISMNPTDNMIITNNESFVIIVLH